MPFIDYKAVLYVIKAVLKIFAVIGVLTIVATVTFIYIVGGFNKDYSVSELKEKYYSKQNEITELRQYFTNIVPVGANAEIEFEGKEMIGILQYSLPIKNAPEDSLLNVSLWHLEIQSSKCDSIIRKLGWTRATIDTIKAKLNNANCISICKFNNGCTVGFKRCGMGIYSFYVPDQPIADSLLSNYNDSCLGIVINDTLVLKYDGGVVGPQCFYKFD